jgi:hypothetical protein
MSLSTGRQLSICCNSVASCCQLTVAPCADYALRTGPYDHIGTLPLGTGTVLQLAWYGYAIVLEHS